MSIAVTCHADASLGVAAEAVGEERAPTDHPYRVGLPPSGALFIVAA